MFWITCFFSGNCGLSLSCYLLSSWAGSSLEDTHSWWRCAFPPLLSRKICSLIAFSLPGAEGSPGRSVCRHRAGWEAGFMASRHGPPWQVSVIQMSEWGAPSAEKSNCQKRSWLSLVRLLSLQKGSGGDGQAAAPLLGSGRKWGFQVLTFSQPSPVLHLLSPLLPYHSSVFKPSAPPSRWGLPPLKTRRTHTGLWFSHCLTVYMLPPSHLLEIPWSPFSASVLLPIVLKTF